jgi:hypothetical protein
VGGALVAVALFAGGLLTRSASATRGTADREQAAGASSATSALRAAEQSPARCRIDLPARRIAPLVVPGSTLSVASFGSEIAVGAVTAGRTGIGLTLSPADLSVLDTQWHADAKHVAAIVPATGRSFLVDRWTQSVPGTSEFTLGMTPRGFSRIDADFVATPIWGGGARDAITRAAIVQAPGRGWAVAFRHGDGPGSVRLGFVDQHGDALGEATRYADTAERAGTPALALAPAPSGAGLALAFAEQPAGGRWRIRIGQSTFGSAPTELRTIASDARAPALTARDGGGFAIGWFEGARADRVLRAQLLDSSLEPRADALRLADVPGALPNVAAWSKGTRTRFVFTREAAPQRAELWAVGLDCE